jgi:hypothetical protein
VLQVPYNPTPQPLFPPLTPTSPAVCLMHSLPPLVTSLCRAKDPDVQIGACQCIALSCADAATAAAYVIAGAAATVCSLLKAGPPESVALSAAAAAATLTGISSGAQQFVEAGGVTALKKVASMSDGVKVASVP